MYDRKLCNERKGEMLCCEPIGHFPKTPHKDGNGEWDNHGSWCRGCHVSDYPHEHVDDYIWTCSSCREPITRFNIGFSNHLGQPQHHSCTNGLYVQFCLAANSGMGFPIGVR